MNASELLSRLRDASDGAPTDRLVSLSLEHALAQPADRWVDAARLTRALKEGLAAWAASPDSEQVLLDALAEWRQEASRDTRTFREVLPREVRQGIHALVRKPFSPDRSVVLAVLDREPIREMIRQLLVDALLDFGKQLRSPVAGVAKGLGGLARMAAETAKSATGSFGTFAGGVVGAVSGEVERQFEKRVTDFADSTLSTVMRRIAEHLSDPKQSAEQGALRVEILEGVLGLTPAQLSREAGKGDVAGSVAVVRDTVERWLSRDGSEAELQAFVEKLLARSGPRTARDVLERLGILEVFTRHARELGRAQLQGLFASDPFAKWVDELFAS